MLKLVPLNRKDIAGLCLYIAGYELIQKLQGLIIYILIYVLYFLQVCSSFYIYFVPYPFINDG